MNLLSPLLMVGVFDQIEGPFVVSGNFNWQIKYVTKIELIDPTYGPDNIFTCLINSNTLSFSHRVRDSSLLLASQRN